MNPVFESFADRLGTALVHSLWQVAAAAALVALVLRAIPKASANARCHVATAALGSCLALFFFALLSPATTQHRPAAPVVSTPTATADPTATGPASAQSIAATPNPTHSPISPSSRSAPRPDQIGVAAYLAGLVFCALRHAIGWLRLRPLRLGGVPIERSHAAILANLATLPDQLGLPHRLPPILVSAAAKAPMLIGLLRPTILLPASAVTGLPEHQLRLVVAHELAHLRRLDPWVNHLQAVAETALFFHPAAWWISRQIRREREHACDDIVVRVLDRPTDYAQALLALQSHAANPGVALAASAGSSSGLAVRIDRILGIAAPPNIRTGALPLAATILIAAAVFTTLPADSPAAPDRPAGVRGSILDRNGVVLATSDNTETRQYPLAHVGAHAIGTIRFGQDGEAIGNMGIEKQSDGNLSAGDDVYLTLDSRILSITDAALADVERAGVVVMDPLSGEILSLVSKPSVGPNIFANGLDNETWNRIMGDAGKPLLNRATTSYTPTFPYCYVTALAADQQIADSVFECDGSFEFGDRFMRCSKQDGHGMVDMRSALAVRCLNYFHNLSSSMDSDELFSAARKMGFGASSGILPNEQSGWTFDRIKHEQGHQTEWRINDTMNTATGYGWNQATPIQVARMTITIANGGSFVVPSLLRSVVENKTGARNEPTVPLPSMLPVSPAHVAMLRQAMFDAVNSSSGSARNAHSPLVAVSGSSGSLNMPGERVADKSIAWFTGFAPFENPKLVVTVVVQGSYPLSANQTAADVAKEILEKSLALP